MTQESFYETDEDAEAALVAVYQGFLWNVMARGDDAYIYRPYVLTFNLCGDDVLAAGAQYGDNDFGAAMNEFRYDNSSEVIRNMYGGFYYAIYYANLVADNFEYGTSTVKDRVISEARVIRAYCHMMLALGWGTPPLVDHVLSASDNPYNCNTDPELDGMDRAGLLRWCANECEESLDYLDERQGPTDKDGAVKVTRDFANAVAGKAYMFAGDYASAESCLAEVINSGNYTLVPASRWEENFHIEGDANEEKVFEANLESNANVAIWYDIVNRSGWMMCQYWNWRTDHFVLDVTYPYSSLEGWGGCGVPQAFAEEFVAYHNEDSERLNASIINIEDLVYDTQYSSPNDDLNSMTREEKETSTRVGLNNSGLYGQSFYLPLKVIAKSTDLTTPGEAVRLNNGIVMRYPEVILLYAEACLNNGNAGNAWQLVRELQERGGVKDEYLIASAADLTLDAIKTEKKFELWLEGCRWLDMVRWGDTDGVLNAGDDIPVLYDKLSREPQSSDENVQWQYGSESNSRFYIVSTHTAKDNGAAVGFQAGKHELFPFPYTVISINPNLTQNPGW